jgi:hypothetical protein
MIVEFGRSVETVAIVVVWLQRLAVRRSVGA